MKHPQLVRASTGVVLCLLLSGTAWAEAPPLFPNSLRYSDRNPAAATGRSGTAQLTLRALYSRSSRTTAVEVTTGALDTNTRPPGQITHVQLKSLDIDGAVRWTRAEKGVGSGAMGFSFPDLLPLQGMHAQALVQDIDGRRTDVVEAVVPVRVRPDLAVSDLGLPAQGRKGMAVGISAMVREQNQDVGASANCALYVDGTRVDQATGIWIDAGSSVSCAFSHVFEEPGSRTVRVALEGVVPGDDDLGNNSQTGTIQIAADIRDIRLGWSLRVMHDEVSAKFVQMLTWQYGRETEYGEQASQSDQVQATAWSSTRLHGPLKITASETSGATTTSTLSRVGWLPQQTWNDATCGGARGQDYDPATGVTFSLETRGCPGSESTSITYDRRGGRVTFFSQRYVEMWFPGWPPHAYWTPNTASVQSSNGLVLVLRDASQHRMRLLIEGEGSRQQAEMHAWLFGASIGWTTPPTCTANPPPSGYCFQSTATQFYILQGSLHGLGTP